jgi:hypothetical protein
MLRFLCIFSGYCAHYETNPSEVIVRNLEVALHDVSAEGNGCCNNFQAIILEGLHFVPGTAQRLFRVQKGYEESAKFILRLLYKDYLIPYMHKLPTCHFDAKGKISLKLYTSLSLSLSCIYISLSLWIYVFVHLQLWKFSRR